MLAKTKGVTADIGESFQLPGHQKGSITEMTTPSARVIIRHDSEREEKEAAEQPVPSKGQSYITVEQEQPASVEVELEDQSKTKVDPTKTPFKATATKVPGTGPDPREADWDKNHIKMLMELCADKVVGESTTPSDPAIEAARAEFLEKFTTTEGRAELHDPSKYNLNIETSFAPEYEVFYLHKKDANGNPIKPPVEEPPAYLSRKINYSVTIACPPGSKPPVEITFKGGRPIQKTIYTSVPANQDPPGQLSKNVEKANLCIDMFAGVVRSAIHSDPHIELQVSKIQELSKEAMLQITSTLLGENVSVSGTAAKSSLSQRVCIYFGDDIKANKPDVEIKVPDMIYRVNGLGTSRIYTPLKAQNRSSDEQVATILQKAKADMVPVKGRKPNDPNSKFIDRREDFTKLDKLTATELEQELQLLPQTQQGEYQKYLINRANYLAEILKDNIAFNGNELIKTIEDKMGRFSNYNTKDSQLSWRIDALNKEIGKIEGEIKTAEAELKKLVPKDTKRRDELSNLIKEKNEKLTNLRSEVNEKLIEQGHHKKEISRAKNELI